MTLRFEVLGHIRVWDKTRIDLDRPSHRRLLAILTLVGLVGYIFLAPFLVDKGASTHE